MSRPPPALVAVGVDLRVTTMFALVWEASAAAVNLPVSTFKWRDRA